MIEQIQQLGRLAEAMGGVRDLPRPFRLHFFLELDNADAVVDGFARGLEVWQRIQNEQDRRRNGGAGFAARDPQAAAPNAPADAPMRNALDNLAAGMNQAAAGRGAIGVRAPAALAPPEPGPAELVHRHVYRFAERTPAGITLRCPDDGDTFMVPGNIEGLDEHDRSRGSNGRERETDDERARTGAGEPPGGPGGAQPGTGGEEAAHDA
ncbi:MAG: hypothetical protein ACREB9_04955, partial [Thermoplasmata archaeon]